MALAGGARTVPVPATVLVVLDGWGVAPDGTATPISLASTPVFDELWSSYPHTQLIACGTAVGLPEGQMGNSEVGHLNLGAGSVGGRISPGSTRRSAMGSWRRIGCSARRSVGLSAFI